MQKNPIFKIVLLVLCAVLAAVLGFCIVPVTSYLKGRNAPLDAELLAAEETGSAQVITISDDELTKLIQGEISLDELEAQPDVIIVKPADSSAAQDVEPSSESANSAVSRTEEASASSEEPNASDFGGSSASNGDTSSAAAANDSPASAASNSTAPAYEAEVKALVQQLYAVQGRAESGLNACISSAKAEFKALPPEQQTQSRKVAICFSKAGQLSALQASCDQEVNSIVSQMRQVLKANGQSTALADQAMSTYKSQKSARYSSLMNQLYH